METAKILYTICLLACLIGYVIVHVNNCDLKRQIDALSKNCQLREKIIVEEAVDQAKDYANFIRHELILDVRDELLDLNKPTKLKHGDKVTYNYSLNGEFTFLKYKKDIEHNKWRAVICNSNGSITSNADINQVSKVKSKPKKK